LLVWFFLRLDQAAERKVVVDSISIPQIKAVLRLPSVWLLMVIILCAYVGYKITDVFSLYAQDVMGFDQVASAQVGTFLLYLRPVVGILIGILADRTQTTFWLVVGFGVMIVGALLFATGLVTATATSFFFFSILVVSTGLYAARALYYAVMERGQIPILLTGTAVGIISLVAYTPDIFAGPTMGYFLDQSPGLPGHQQVFWMLAIFGGIGAIAAGIYHRKYGKASGE
ncbi:MAG: MFS transporter, partial [Bacteroidota bacterium]